MHRLESAADPRIIFVGGSGLAFGLDSEIIEKETRLNPVNMGVYAGFGIDYLAAQVSSRMHTGDTVVLIPEYDILTKDPSANGFLVLEAAQALPSTVRFSLSNTDSIAEIVRAFPAWLSTRAVSLLGRIAEPLIGRSDTLYHRVYRASAFNAYGDNTAVQNESFRLPASDISTSTASILLTPLSTTTLDHIALFIDAAEARGVLVYISWPALPRSLERIAHENIERSDARLRERFGTRILGTQNDFIFDDSDFFDTVNHLTTNARTIRSQRLANLIREAKGSFLRDERQ
jgi:hypothetical protein